MASKKFLTPVNLLNLATDPNTALDGDIYYNTAEEIIKVFSNSAWVPVGNASSSQTTVSETAPTNPEIGDTWYVGTTGSFYLWDGTFWVEVNGIVAGVNSFNTISITGQDDVVADGISDTLTLVAGDGITLATDATTDSITITANTTYPFSEEPPVNPAVGDLWFDTTKRHTVLQYNNAFLDVPNGISNGITAQHYTSASPNFTGSTDDGYWTFNLVSPTIMNGVSYDIIHISTNSYIAYGSSGSDWFLNNPQQYALDDDVPNMDKIFIGAGDRSCNSIYFLDNEVGGFFVKYEGYASNGLDGERLIWQFWEEPSEALETRYIEIISYSLAGGSTYGDLVVSGIYSKNSCLAKFILRENANYTTQRVLDTSIGLKQFIGQSSGEFGRYNTYGMEDGWNLLGDNGLDYAENISSYSPDYILFDTTPENSSTDTGTIYWDSGDGVPKAILAPGVEIGLGQEQVVLVKNATGSTIPKAKVVYINGAQGQRPTIALSDADAETTSSKTLGLTAEEITDGSEGFVTTFGVLRGVNTGGLTQGAALWLSSTAGGYTTTLPVQPQHMVFVGYVVKAHSTAGEIFVNPQNGYELHELHNVLIDAYASVADNELLAYDTASSLWKNQTADEANIVDKSSNQTIGGDKSFTGAITYGSIANQNTNVVSLNTATATTIYTLSNTYSSAEFLIQATQSTTKKTLVKLLMVTDGTDISLSSYGFTEIGSPPIPLTISATTSGSDLLLKATVSDANINNVTIRVVATAIVA